MKSTVLLLLVTLGLTGQERIIRPQVQPPGDQPGKASIEGNVLDAVTHEPIKKTTVSLNGRTSLMAITDASGHFAFRELPAGKYTLQAHNDKYPAPQNGFEVEQAPISLAADEKKRDVNLTLTPGASVDGHVVDEEGNPMPRCMVARMRFRDTEAGWTFGSMGSVQSDDKGEYRIANILPGKYYIMARCFQSIELPHAFIPRGPLKDLPVLTYAAQFYPGASAPSGAAKVQASPNANLAGIDFRMLPATGVTVRGRITVVPSDHNLRIVLQPKDPVRREWHSPSPRFNPSTGEFHFSNVESGSYEVIAAGSGDGLSYFAQLPVEVGTAPLEPIDVVLSPVPALSGTISIEGEVKLPMSNLQVTMQPLNSRPIMQPPPQVQVQNDGTFTLNSVLPGRWRLAVNGAPGYLKSVTQGDHELSPVDFEVAPSVSSPLKIVIGTKFVQVDATVFTPPSATDPVFAILWAADGDPNRRQTGTVSPQGLSALNAPPGKYFGCAVAGAQPWRLMQSRALLKILESACQAVDLVEGDRTRVLLPLISTEDLKRLAEKLEE